MAIAQFYLLSPEQPLEQRACDLACEAYRAGLRVLIVCRDQAQAFALDEMLWAQEASFVPHNLFGEETSVPTPVEITWGNQRNAQSRQLLINLSDTVPEFAHSFLQCWDFVPVDEAGKALARVRYQQLRQAGWQMEMK